MGGFDLAALNIQRARDHGIPSYTAYKRQLLHEEIRNFTDLLKYMNEATVEKLRSVYSYVRLLFSCLLFLKPRDGF